MAFADPKTLVASFGLAPGMQVADFGAGAGYFAIAASDAVGEDGAVYVIDIRQELLTKAKTLDQRHRENLHFICSDLEKENGSRLKEASMDMVIVANMLFQVEHKRAVLGEAYRVLQRGGKLMLIDWSESYGGLGPAEEHVLGAKEGTELALSVGFALQKRFEAGDHHWGLSFVKK